MNVFLSCVSRKVDRNTIKKKTALYEFNKSFETR